MSIANLTANVRNALTALENADVAARDRRDAMRAITDEAESMLHRLTQRAWAEEAREHPEHRLEPDHPNYMVHLRHCYPKDGVDGYPAGCKYGEDKHCPAALFDDPWAEYLRVEDEREAAKNG